MAKTYCGLFLIDKTMFALFPSINRVFDLGEFSESYESSVSDMMSAYCRDNNLTAKSFVPDSINTARVETFKYIKMRCGSLDPFIKHQLVDFRLCTQPEVQK